MMDLGGAPDMGMGAGMLQIGRWVLYDKDEMFVKTVASPVTYQGVGKIDFGVYEFSCTYINFWETDFIGMLFDLKTGNPKPCYKNYASWKDANAYFGDPNCSSAIAPMTPGSALPVLQVGGSMFFATTNSPIVDTLYVWDKNQNSCTQTNLQGYEFHEYKPVPEWVLVIMDSPPYTMVLEY